MKTVSSLFRAAIIAFLAFFGTIAANAYSGRLISFPNSLINKIYQDSEGYIWVCTEYGLSRYDGVSTKTFYHTASANSLLNNCVLSITEDRGGTIWIGTIAGIQSYDRKTEKFTTVELEYPGLTDFTYINSIIEDSKGNIWFSTSHSGVVCLKAESREPVYYLTTNSNLCSNMITALFEDHYGNIWIGSKNKGVSVLNPDNRLIQNYSCVKDDERTLSSDMVFSIVEARDGSVLVATIDGGIDMFDNQKHSFRRRVIPCDGNVYTLYPDYENVGLLIGTDGNGLKAQLTAKLDRALTLPTVKEFNLSKGKIHSILRDHDGNLWLGVYQKGVVFVPRGGLQITNYTFNPYNSELNIGAESVAAIMLDNNRNIWIGTDGDGVYLVNDEGLVKRHYTAPVLAAPSVLCIHQDHNGDIWLGAYLHGLFRYNRAADRFDMVDLASAPGEPSPKEINCITEDADGNLWLGTNGNGVCIYNPRNGQSRFLAHSPAVADNQLAGNSIHVITFDRTGKAWIGTSDAGVTHYSPTDNIFTNYTTANSGLSSNNIYDIHIGSDANIWIATKAGLNKMRGDSIRVYTTSDGLPNDVIVGIEESTDRHLWLSTYGGLADFDPDSERVLEYSVADGLACREYQRGAHLGTDYDLYFGGLGGMSAISLQAPISNDKHCDHKLIFSDLYVDNKIVTPDSDIISVAINHADRITLPRDFNSFTLNYSTLDYSNPSRAAYSVYLTGFDNGWIEQPAESHAVTYSNLPPGDYDLHVRATLTDGDVVERSVRLTVTPPFYMTWWARIIEVLLIAALLFYLYRLFRRKQKRQQQSMAEASEKELMEEKLQFFTDISHEVRTPLTLILSPVSKLMETTTDTKLLETLNIIDRNGKRILRMINQVMELRKLDNHKMKLSVAETPLRELIDSIYSSFIEYAESNNITYTISYSDDVPQKVWVDCDKFDKILFNLLSNAFKFTPAGGSINVEVSLSGERLRVSVTDTGTGIAPSEHEAIFTRFYRVADNSTQARIGTGIGLHLSRKLTELHHGSIYVESSAPGEGSVFVILLPIMADVYTESERLAADESYVRPNVELHKPEIEAPKPSAETSESVPEVKAKSMPTVLIVEDDRDIIEYLKSELTGTYHLILAGNGKEGLEKALRLKPDCIVSDISMPVMNGTEMCRLVKSNPDTCDIPVILLTAKTSNDSRIEGLKHGADSYIPKPFNISHLRTRIAKLIELRRQMRDKYTGKNNVSDSAVPIKSADDKLLERVRACVIDRLADPDLSVEVIAQEVGVSRSQLHRKLKSLTGQNPSDYIKQTRLHHAAYLLVKKGVAVSEAAYAAGFSSLSYFSTSFKDIYGVSPSKYVEINRDKNGNDEADKNAENTD